jgi:hypothetical protein
MADSIQKEAFRKYLESAGVIDALTKGDTSLLQAPYSCIHKVCRHNLLGPAPAGAELLFLLLCSACLFV